MQLALCESLKRVHALVQSIISQLFGTRRRGILILLLLYLSVWLGFGILYRHLATVSRGQCFIMHSDVRNFSRAQAFKRMTQSEVDDHVILDLVQYDDVESKLFYRSLFEDAPPHLQRMLDKPSYYTRSTNRPLGSYWGKYYRRMFERLGYTHYFVLHSPDDQLVTLLPGQPEAYRVSLVLYDVRKWKLPTPPHQVSMPVPPRDRAPERVYDGLLAVRQPVPLRIGGVKHYFLPVRYYLEEFLGSLVVFPEFRDIDAFAKVMKDDYPFPLRDFLYFSAVTITTLGYGDILPKTSPVRVLVTLEVFLGVFLVGMAVNIMFSGER